MFLGYAQPLISFRHREGQRLVQSILGFAPYFVSPSMLGST